MTQKAYRFWIPTTRKIKISRDVIFNEDLAHAENPVSHRDTSNLFTTQTNFPVSTSTVDREFPNPSSPSPVDAPAADLHSQDAIPSDESEHSNEKNPDQPDANQPEEELQNPHQPAERAHTHYEHENQSDNGKNHRYSQSFNNMTTNQMNQQVFPMR